MDGQSSDDPARYHDPDERTPAQGLVRPRLSALLDAARPAALALVVAPAGFGKTTVLRHYATSHRGPVAWFSVDAEEAAAGLATERLAGAIRAASALRVAGGTAADGLLVIIDDADGLTGTPDETLIDRFLAQRPPGTHVVLAGRRMPVLNLLRHEVFAVPGLIGPDHLRFRAWEVERLLSTVYAEPLPVGDAALLTRRTGGWAAGLAMFHLSTQGRPLAARQRAVAALSGRWSMARDYLGRTLLDGLAPDLREFVVATSVFDVLTGPRCDALLDRTGSDRVLDSLAHRYGLPMSADGGETYHHHQVLRSHLRTALVDRVGAAEAARSHARAARLLAAEGAAAEAVRAHARAGDLTAVRCLLARSGAELTQPGAEPLQDVLPAWLLAEDPWLVYAEASQQLGNGQLRAALRGFRTAEALFDDDDLGGDAGADAGAEGLRRCRDGQRVARAWLSEGPDDRTHWSAWLRATVRRYPAAVAGEAIALPGSGGELVRLVADLLAGNLREPFIQAATTPGRVRTDGSVAAIGTALLRAALQLAAVTGTASGSALARLDMIADEADAAGAAWLSRMARAARVLSGAPATATEASDVAAECERHGDAWGHTLATLLGCLRDWRDGHPDIERLATVADQCGQLGASVLQAWARSLQVLAGVSEDLPDAEDEAMAAADFAARAGVPGARIAATVAVARLDPVRRARLLDGALAEARTIGLPDNVLARWGAGPAPLPDQTPAPTPAYTVDRVAPVWIRCFGGFRMEVDGRPVELSTVRARARATLRLLAMQAGQVVHREILIEALWPDLPPPAATRNLQVSISALRGLLEPASVRGKAQLLIRSGDAYGIALPPGGYADTTAFTDAVQRWKRIRRTGRSADGELQAMREALAAYGGELLPEDGPADWAVPAREHFRLQATQVARALAVAEIDGGNRSDAIATAEFCLTLDPHDDEAWRVLVRAYSGGGAPAKAVEVRRRYAEMLASLGVPAVAPPLGLPTAVSAGRSVRPVRTLPAQRSLPAGPAAGRRRT